MSRGAVDVDKYYREAEDAVRKTPPSRLVGVFNEVFEQHIGALPVVEPNALHLGIVAGALFRAAYESEDVVVLFGYSYALLAGGKPLDAAIFLPASTTAVATLLKKISIDLKNTVNLACGAVELAGFFENADTAGIPGAY